MFFFLCSHLCVQRKICRVSSKKCQNNIVSIMANLELLTVISIGQLSKTQVLGTVKSWHHQCSFICCILTIDIKQNWWLIDDFVWCLCPLPTSAPVFKTSQWYQGRFDQDFLKGFFSRFLQSKLKMPPSVKHVCVKVVSNYIRYQWWYYVRFLHISTNYRMALQISVIFRSMGGKIMKKEKKWRKPTKHFIDFYGAIR